MDAAGAWQERLLAQAADRFRAATGLAAELVSDPYEEAATGLGRLAITTNEEIGRAHV